MSRVEVSCSRTQRRERSGAALRFAAMVARLRRTVALWRQRADYRRALARMSERELNDIGVGWSDIAEEASKPFWRA